MMPKDFKTVNNKDSFYFPTNLEQYDLSFDKCYSLLYSLEKVSVQYDINHAALKSIIQDILHIQNRDLFEYTTMENKNSILIREKGIYVNERVQYGRQYKIEQKYYDVYLVQNEFFSNHLSSILLEVFKLRFPKIYNYPCFSKTVRRFPETLEGSIMPFTKLSDLYMDYNLTCQDVTDLIDNPQCINDLCQVSKFKFYDNSDVFYLELDTNVIHNEKYPCSLTIPVEAILTKDWSLIENYKVYSVIKLNANEKLGKDKNNWFNGLQKDTEYFNHPLVQELKKFF